MWFFVVSSFERMVRPNSNRNNEIKLNTHTYTEGYNGRNLLIVESNTFKLSSLEFFFCVRLFVHSFDLILPYSHVSCAARPDPVERFHFSLSSSPAFCVRGAITKNFNRRHIQTKQNEIVVERIWYQVIQDPARIVVDRHRRRHRRDRTNCWRENDKIIIISFEFVVIHLEIGSIESKMWKEKSTRNTRCDEINNILNANWTERTSFAGIAGYYLAGYWLPACLPAYHTTPHQIHTYNEIWLRSNNEMCLRKFFHIPFHLLCCCWCWWCCPVHVTTDHITRRIDICTSSPMPTTTTTTSVSFSQVASLNMRVHRRSCRMEKNVVAPLEKNEHISRRARHTERRCS